MDSKKPHSLRSLLTRIVGTLVGVPLLYVLSVGPSTVLTLKFPESGPLIGPLYKPLAYAVFNTSVEPPLMAYSRFWARLAGFGP